MKVETLNENYGINRKARGVKATAKLRASQPIAVPSIADGTAYDASRTYHFFDASTQEVRQSTGLRRDGEYLSTFGLRVVAVVKLHTHRNDALTDAQNHFRAEIERLRGRIAGCEAAKIVQSAFDSLVKTS